MAAKVRWAIVGALVEVLDPAGRRKAGQDDWSVDELEADTPEPFGSREGQCISARIPKFSTCAYTCQHLTVADAKHRATALGPLGIPEQFWLYVLLDSPTYTKRRRRLVTAEEAASSTEVPG